MNGINQQRHSNQYQPIVIEDSPQTHLSQIQAIQASLTCDPKLNALSSISPIKIKNKSNINMNAKRNGLEVIDLCGSDDDENASKPTKSKTAAKKRKQPPTNNNFDHQQPHKKRKVDHQQQRTINAFWKGLHMLFFLPYGAFY